VTAFPNQENVMDINIGIDSKNREQITAALSKVQADTYTLYLKTHKPPLRERLRSPSHP
jgi:hypothetical protein